MSFIETLNNPSMVHAAVVHLPVALAVFGIPLVYLCATIARENELLRWITVACYAALALTAFVAMQSGEGAMGKVPAQLPKEIWDEIQYHESLGEVVWMLGTATAALVALSAIRIRTLQATVMSLAMLASLGTGVWVAITGHHGGMLVYERGVGTPAMQFIGAGPATPVGRTPADPAPVDPAAFESVVEGDGLDPKLLPFTMDEAKQVSYAKDIQPLLEEVCTECHRPRRTQSELDMTTVAGMLAGGEKLGPSIVPGNPDASTIVQYIRGQLQPQMPKDELPLVDGELRTLRMWIAAGAVDDSADAETP